MLAISDPISLLLRLSGSASNFVIIAANLLSIVAVSYFYLSKKENTIINKNKNIDSEFEDND